MQYIISGAYTARGSIMQESVRVTEKYYIQILIAEKIDIAFQLYACIYKII